MIADDLLPLARPIDSLKPLEGNPRKGDVQAVMRSYDRFGQRKPIVALKDGTVIAGNHQLKAARELGWTEIAVVFVEDDEQTAQAFALADNRTADLGTYDNEALADMLKAVSIDPELLSATGYDADDLAELLDSIEPLPAMTGDPDAVPDTAPAKTARGDVWLLGDHRLMCRNSMGMDLPNCDALISDPPYGMRIDTSWYGRPVGKSIGANRVVTSNHSYKGKLDWDQDDFNPTIFASHCETVALFGANYFCTNLPESGTWWVWDKRTTESGDTQNAYGMPFELIWIKGEKAHRIIRHLWAGFTRKSEAADKERLHPTQKPVAVMRELIEYLTEKGQIVFDPFGGSGSTLIACHQTGRICYTMELDEHYCDVICKRFQQATGIMPIAEATGNEHNFLED
jgi:hypothetical protein